MEKCLNQKHLYANIHTETIPLSHYFQTFAPSPSPECDHDNWMASFKLISIIIWEKNICLK